LILARPPDLRRTGAAAELGFDSGAEACGAQGMLALEEQADCSGF
jgi:hypothetical protein